MSGASKFLSQRVLLATLRNVPMEGFSGLKIALFTADPIDEIQNEISAAFNPWYARAACSEWTAPAEDGDKMFCTNAQIVEFADSTTTVTVTHWGVVDSSAQGSLLYSAPINGGTPRTIVSGEKLQCNVGSLKVSMT